MKPVDQGTPLPSRAALGLTDDPVGTFLNHVTATIRSANLRSVPPDCAALEKDFAIAMTLHYIAPVPMTTVPGQPPAPTDLAAFVASASSIMSRLYLPGATRDRELSGLSAIQHAEAGSTFRLIDGGVAEIDVEGISETPSSATVKGTVSSWQDLEVKQGSGAWTPLALKGTLHVVMTFSLEGGKWAVADWVGTQDPAAAP